MMAEYELHVSSEDRLKARAERLERENTVLHEVVRKLVLDSYGISMRLDVEGVKDPEAHIREAVTVGAQALARALMEGTRKLGDLYQEIALYRNALNVKQYGRA